MTAAAAFDLPASPPDRATRLRGVFREPGHVLRTDEPSEVATVVDAAEQAARDGRWVVGGIGYQAGVSDPAQTAHRPATAALFEVFDGPPQPWTPVAPDLAALDWGPCIDAAGQHAAIEQIQRLIAAGQCYQVNLTGPWRAARPVDLELFDYFQALAARQPAGYAIFSAAASVLSVSPELFFHRDGARLVTEPMKGTAAAEADPSTLVDSAKNQAENLMIVDLLRNDLGRICRPGSVTVERLFELVRLPTVWQLTSTITGTIEPSLGLSEIIAALFPCGSVTGAPKVAAMRIIADLEPQPRGWYCGAFGVIRPGGIATFAVPIRTVEATATLLRCGIGSGVVADSEPRGELDEWQAKARFLGGAPLRLLETMRTQDGTVLRLERHLARVSRSAADLGIPVDLPAVRAQLVAACPRDGAHRLRAELDAAGAHLTVSPAPPLGRPVSLRLASEPLDIDALRSVIRNKTTHRAHYQRLRDLAADGVFDVICHDGEVLTECCLGNLAVCLDGVWYTPRDEGNLLPGVLRAELIQAGRLTERRLPLSVLGQAEQVAFVNALRGWCPAAVVGSATI